MYWPFADDTVGGVENARNRRWNGWRRRRPVPERLAGVRLVHDRDDSAGRHANRDGRKTVTVDGPSAGRQIDR